MPSSKKRGSEATPMSRLISKGSHHDAEADFFLDNPPFPLAGAAVGLIAVLNVASVTAMLLSI
jgi:hypothetical protein